MLLLVQTCLNLGATVSRLPTQL